jgi:drug/metabolite transporter (DMT)-like permease
MYALFALSLALAVGKNILSKTGKKYFGDFSGLLTMNIVTGGFAVVLFLCWGLNFRLMDNGTFWLIALLYGVCTTAAQMFHVTAVKYGDLSVCVMIYASGFLVSTLFSVFYFHETVGILKGLGLFLTCVSIFLINARFPKTEKGAEKKKGSYKYLLFAIPAMLCCGLVGVMQKLFAAHCAGVEFNEYLFVAFSEMLLISGVVKGIVWLIEKKKRRKTEKLESGTETVLTGEKTLEKRTKKEWWQFALNAVGFAACVVLMARFNLYLTGVMDGIIFFPVYNGGSIAVTALFAFFVFKEKPTLFKVVGIVVGIFSFVLIAI